MHQRARRALLPVVIVVVSLAAPTVARAAEQYVPLLVYRTGPYAPNGVPLADGQADYFAMLNARDGGIGGVRLLVEECDTAYDPELGVECYQLMKDRGPTGASVFAPFSTGIAAALLAPATADEIPLFTLGYGRSATADGTVFPYAFPLPTTYASQMSSIVRYLATRSGGDLDGADLAFVHLDSAYGNEPIPVLERLAEAMAFTVHRFPVAHPGLEQKRTWVDVARLDPDWVVMWGWGVMNATAIREAAAAGFPRERMIGNHWAGAEVDVAAAGDAAVGYLAANFHAVGDDFEVHADIRRHVAAAAARTDARPDGGGVLYNRGVVNAAITAEAIRVAQGIHGRRPLTGAEVRDGFERLALSADRLAELGLAGMMRPVAISCADHAGAGAIFVQRWDGARWERVSDWIMPLSDLVRPVIEDQARAYAAANGITPRRCPPN